MSINNKKRTALIVGSIALTPVLITTLVSCKTPEEILNDSINQGINFQPTINCKKVTSQYLVDQFKLLKSQNKSDQEIKLFLSTFLSNWPKEDKNVKITPINVEQSNIYENGILLSLKYSVRNSEQIETINLPFFRTQKELEQEYVESAIDQEWDLVLNHEELLKSSAVEVANALNNKSEEYTKYFTNIPESVIGSNLSWVNGNIYDSFYSTANVIVDLNSLRFEAIDESQLKVIATYRYGSYKTRKTHIIKGFRGAEEEFNKLINQIELSLDSTKVGNVSPSQVNISNIREYILGIPLSSSDLIVNIDSVRPLEDNKTNKTLLITITYTSPIANSVTKTITYEIDGFASEEDLDFKEIDKAIENLRNKNLVANSFGTKVIASEINEMNIFHYVDNIPSYINNVEIDIVEVTVEDITTGTINVLFSFTKGTTAKSTSILIGGFLSSIAQDQNHVDEIYDLTVNNLTPTNLVSQHLPSDVNEANVEEYIVGWPSLKNGVSRKIIFKPQDSTGILEISVYYYKNAAKSKTYDLFIYNFKTSNSQDQEIVDNAIDSLKELIPTNEVSNTYIQDVNIENITQFVVGFPWEPGTVNSQGVLLTIKSVFIKNNGEGTYSSNLISIELEFKKGNVSRTIIKEIEGFVSEKQNDINKISELILSLKLSVNNESIIKNQMRPQDVNLLNYEEYILGVPLINDKGVNVLVQSIYPTKNTDKNEMITIVIQFKRGQITEILEKQIDGFLSNWDYWQNILDEKANQLSSLVHLEITELGKQSIASLVDKDNISQYVSNIPTLENGIYLEIERISVNPLDDKSIDIDFEISYTLTSGTLYSRFSLTCSGFRSNEEQIKIDVDYVANNHPNLLITNEGLKVLASKVNKSNFNIYVSGIKTESENNGIKTIIDSIEVNPLNDTELIVRMYFTKRGYSSIIITRTVNGFKSLVAQNLEDIEQVYNEYKNIQLTLSALGQNVVSSVVTNENIHLYVLGFPVEINNNVQLSIDQLIPEDGQLTIIFSFKKGNEKSLSITRLITGFRRFNIQDQIDVDKMLNATYDFVVNELGKNTTAQTITINNVNDYVGGLPVSQNGVEIIYSKVEPKTNNLNDLENIQSILLEITFVKGTYSASKTYEIKGFKKPTELEIFEYNVALIQFDISDLGKDIVGDNVTISNIQESIIPKLNNDFQKEITINYLSWSATKEDGTQLTILTQFTKGNLQMSREIVVNGFKSKIIQSQENIAILENEYINLSKNYNLSTNNILTKEFYDNPSLVNKYFEIPKDKQWINVSLEVRYVGNDSSLSNTSVLFIWTLTNTITGEKTTIRNRFDDQFKDPYQFYSQVNNSTIRVNATNENTNGIYNYSQQRNGILMGTYQVSWLEWGKYPIFNDYLNNYGNNFIKIIPTLVKDSLKSFIQNDPIKLDIISTTKTTDEWDKSKANGINDWAIWLGNTINCKLTYEGYPPINIVFIMKVGVINGYWK